MLLCQDPLGAKRRLTAWWRGEAVEGVVWTILARRDTPRQEPPVVPEAQDLEDRWTNPSIRIAQFENHLAWTEYLGDGIPYFDTQIGPGSFGLFVGVSPHFAPTTVWYDPCLQDLSDPGRLRFDPENKWWRVHVDLVRAGLDASEGRYLVSIPDLVEGLDTLAAAYNNQRLLYALIDEPEAVHAHLRRLGELYFEAYDPLYKLVKEPEGGCVYSAFVTWAPGRYAKVQCDIAATLGPRQFAEFVAPYLAEQTQRLEYAMFHLDGKDCIVHLDQLLDIPSIQVIQWTPGAGQPPVDDPCWFDMYRRILERKRLILIGTRLERAREVVEAIGTQGVHLVTFGVPVDEGLRAIEESRNWSD